MIDIRKEAERVRYQRLRAEKEGLLATLNLEEWLFILAHFEYKCAYCGDCWQVMEHIIPVIDGGGTTAQNIVPACTYCNIVKDRFKFTQIISEEDIEKVSQELAGIQAHLDCLADTNSCLTAVSGEDLEPDTAHGQVPQVV